MWPFYHLRIQYTQTYAYNNLPLCNELLRRRRRKRNKNEEAFFLLMVFSSKIIRFSIAIDLFLLLHLLLWFNVWNHLQNINRYAAENSIISRIHQICCCVDTDTNILIKFSFMNFSARLRLSRIFFCVVRGCVRHYKYNNCGIRISTLHEYEYTRVWIMKMWFVRVRVYALFLFLFFGWNTRFEYKQHRVSIALNKIGCVPNDSEMCRCIVQ